MNKISKALVGLAVPALVTVGLAAPASANTGPPPPTGDPSVCVRAFAATGLQVLQQYQNSNKSPEANANLRNGLAIALTGYLVCLGEQTK